MRVITLLLFQFLLSNQIVIDLVTTNDIHGVIQDQKAYFMNPQYPPNIVGGAGFYKYINKLNDENLIVLDGGNFFQGSNLGMQDKGKTIIKWMDMIGYDAVVPGQYDFIFGMKNLNDIMSDATFEVLGSNINCDNCIDNIKPYIIKEIQGVKFGILGIINSSISELVPASKLDGAKFDFEFESLNKWVPEIKKNGADIIIVLTSSGVPWDREEVYDNFMNSPKDSLQSLNAIEMGYYANGVDLIVSGGISKGYKTAWYDPYSHVYTIQNYGNGTSFGHVQLQVDLEYKKLIGINYANNNEASHTLFSDDFEPDKEIKKWIKSKLLSKDNIIDSNLNNIKFIDSSTDDWDVPSINTEEGLEIITWNCEFFPTANDSTIRALSEVVKDLNADIIAFQEIRKPGWFEKLMQNLSDYEYVLSLQSSFMDLAIIYKKDMFEFKSHSELFADNDYNFAGRPPLKVNLTHKLSGKEFSLINLHMKCCDSGLNRRKEASKMLYDYIISDSFIYDSSIILGDWNDDLKDKPKEHCFAPFLQDDNFYFVTSDIVYDINQATYPKEPYVSFLDHILISKKLINTDKSVETKGYKVYTIPIDDYMGSYDNYETYISDHKPVLLSLDIKNLLKIKSKG